MSKLFRRIQTIDDCETRLDADLSNLTTMRVGGKAACLAIPHTEKALQEVLQRAHRLKIPLFVLGGGSNTIFMDAGFDGIVLKLGNTFNHVRRTSGFRYTVGAGAELRQFVRHSLRRGLQGMEWCLGIPGTIGGALAGNSGTGDHGACEGVTKVWGYTREGERYEYSEFPFGYRYSGLRNTIIAGANYLLKGCENADQTRALKERVMKLTQARKIQPYNMPSAGCIFKNPNNNSAGKLIDLAGLKGYGVGEIEVSDRHANFIVNTGKGTAEDLVYLICCIRQSIKEKYDLDLQLEVQLISSEPMVIEPKSDLQTAGRSIAATVMKPSASEPVLSFT